MNNLNINSEQIDEMVENPSPMHSLMLAADLKTFIAFTHFAINGANFQFQDFHFLVIKKLQDIAEQKNVKRNLAICMPVGCLSGDTLIRINRKGKGSSKKISDCYRAYNKTNKNKNHNWKDEDTKVRSYFQDKNLIKLNDTLDFVYSGYKEVYEMALEDGKSIKATPEHKILTSKGWVELAKLTDKDYVMVDNLTKHKKKIKKVEKKKVVDKRRGVGKYHKYSKLSIRDVMR